MVYTARARRGGAFYPAPPPNPQAGSLPPPRRPDPRQHAAGAPLGLGLPDPFRLGLGRRQIGLQDVHLIGEGIAAGALRREVGLQRRNGGRIGRRALARCCNGRLQGADKAADIRPRAFRLAADRIGRHENAHMALIIGLPAPFLVADKPRGRCLRNPAGLAEYGR
jgi:hypothetical protein